MSSSRNRRKAVTHKYKKPRDKGTLKCESHGTCPVCGKQKFASRKEAREAARRIFPGETIREYECDGWWHHTHASASRTAYLRREQ